MIDKIFNFIRNSEKKIIIGIDGKSGSGKTTLANLIANNFDCNIFHTDDFFLQPYQRTKERFLLPGENIDHERMKSEIFDLLPLEKSFFYSPFSCSIMDFLNPILINPKKVNIIEGVYSMHFDFINIYSLKIFIDISQELQYKRILNRDGEEKLQRYIDEWIPLENRYFDKFEIAKKCDLIIRTEENKWHI